MRALMPADDGICNLFRISQAFERSVGRPGFENFFLTLSLRGGATLGQFLEPIRCGVARTNVVHQNAVLTKFVSQAFDQTYYGSSDGIGKHQIGHRLFSANGSEGDDSSPALALHVRDDFASEVDRAEKVQVHSLPPILNGGR